MKLNFIKDSVYLRLDWESINPKNKFFYLLLAFDVLAVILFAFVFPQTIPQLAWHLVAIVNIPRLVHDSFVSPNLVVSTVHP